MLMLCRLAYTTAHRRMCSKRKAGEWGLTDLAPEWHPLIAGDLRAYAASEGEAALDETVLLAFERYIIEYVETASQQTSTAHEADHQQES